MMFLNEVVAVLSGEDDNVIHSRRVGDWVVQDAGWNSASNSERERERERGESPRDGFRGGVPRLV